MRFDPQSNYLPSERPQVAHQAGGGRGGLSLGAVAAALLVAGGIGAWIWKSTTIQSASTFAAGVVAPPEEEAPATDAPTLEDAEDGAASAPDAAQDDAVTATPPRVAPPAENNVAAPQLDEETLLASREAYESGRSLMAFGRFRDAIPFLEDSTDLDPSFAEGRYRLGMAYLRARRLNDAREQRDLLRTQDASLASLLDNLIRSRSKK